MFSLFCSIHNVALCRGERIVHREGFVPSGATRPGAERTGPLYGENHSLPSGANGTQRGI